MPIRHAVAGRVAAIQWGSWTAVTPGRDQKHLSTARFFTEAGSASNENPKDDLSDPNDVYAKKRLTRVATSGSSHTQPVARRPPERSRRPPMPRCRLPCAGRHLCIEIVLPSFWKSSTVPVLIAMPMAKMIRVGRASGSTGVEKRSKASRATAPTPIRIAIALPSAARMAERPNPLGKRSDCRFRTAVAAPHAISSPATSIRLCPASARSTSEPILSPAVASIKIWATLNMTAHLNAGADIVKHNAFVGMNMHYGWCRPA